MAQTEFAAVGCNGVKRYCAMPGKTPFESFNESQYNMIYDFAAKGIEKTLITFEDDVLFKGITPDIDLEYAITELPPNWDILYLGCNLFSENWELQPPVRHSANLSRIYHAWTTHAVAYSRKGAKWIMSHYDRKTMYDAWLSNNILNHLNAFVMRPMIAFQRPGFSDLWNNEANYTDCFVEGNKLLARV